MKRLMICVFGMSVLFCGSFFVQGSESSNNQPYEIKVEEKDEMQSGSFVETDLKNGIDRNSAVSTNCRYYRCYYRYYRPYVYYRPVCYRYYYIYRYVIFYNGVESTESNGQKGCLLSQTPDVATPLGKQGIKKGDIITHINGRKIESAADLDSITENSRLTVLKSKNTSSSQKESSRQAILDSLYGAF